MEAAIRTLCFQVRCVGTCSDLQTQGFRELEAKLVYILGSKTQSENKTKHVKGPGEMALWLKALAIVQNLGSVPSTVVVGSQHL